MGGWVGLRAGLDTAEKWGDASMVCRESNPNYSGVRPVTPIPTEQASLPQRKSMKEEKRKNKERNARK
jgi:hypothetical protein